MIPDEQRRITAKLDKIWRWGLRMPHPSPNAPMRHKSATIWGPAGSCWQVHACSQYGWRCCTYWDAAWFCMNGLPVRLVAVADLPEDPEEEDV